MGDLVQMLTGGKMIRALPAAFILLGGITGCPGRGDGRNHAAMSVGSTGVLISTEMAKDIAMAAMQTSTNDAQFVHVIPVPTGSGMAWTVQFAHPIAGAWEVQVDRGTGTVLNKRVMPSR